MTKSEALTIIKQLDKIIELLEATKTNKKEQDTTKKLIELLSLHNLPTDEKYIEDIERIINKTNLNNEEVNQVFIRLDKYQQDNKVKDIKKLSFKFLYNEAKERGNNV